MSFRMFLAACLILVSSPAIAEILGRTTFDGRVIILHDDNSWEYADEADETDEDAPAEERQAEVTPEGCTEIASEVVPVSVCLDPDKWERSEISDAQEHGFSRKEQELYVMVITEKEVIEIDTLKKAILINAQTAAGLNKVDVVEDEKLDIDGKQFGRIRYRTTVDDVDVTYLNYYTSFEGSGSLQLIGFAASDDFETVLPDIEEVVASIKLNQ